MSEKRDVIREIVWWDIFPWLMLVRAFRLSISPRVLVLAAAGLVATSAGFRLLGTVFDGYENRQLQAWIQSDSAWPWENHHGSRADLSHNSIGRRFENHIPLVGSWFSDGPNYRSWRILTRPYWNTLDRSAGISGLTYSICCCGWMTLVWAILAGPITRIAALAFTREESTGLRTAITYARSRLSSYWLAPILPMLGAFITMLPLAILGWITQIELGMLLGGILWPLVLLSGLFLSILLIGLAAGWPLMWPTISTEGTDAFDALSRSYAYVYQRPLRLLFYILVASVLGLLGVFVVDLFATATVRLAQVGISWSLDPSGPSMGGLTSSPFVEPPEHGVLHSGGVALIHFWNGFVTTLQVAFQFSFFWVSATGIYLLLRRDVDAIELDEVDLDEQAEVFDLPPLTSDESGVPGVADENLSSGDSPAEDSSE